MKKAFSTVACMGLEWQQVLACAIQAGMDAVEIRMDNDGRIFGLDEADLPGVIQAFESKGVKISNLGTGVQLTGYDDEKMIRARRCVMMAHTLGAQGIRIFLGSFVKRFSDPTPHDEDGIVRFLQELADFAVEYHIELWIETHNEYSTGVVLRQLLDHINRSNVRVIWDLIHPYEFGEAPEDTLRHLGDDLVHVHIKDGVKTDDPDWIDYRYTRLGEGQLPLEATVRLLEQAGYNGYYSLEWENAWRPEIRDLYENLPQVLDAWNDYFTQHMKPFANE